MILQESGSRLTLEDATGFLLLEEEGGTGTAGVPAAMLLSDRPWYEIATSDIRIYAVGVADEARTDITVSDDPGD